MPRRSAPRTAIPNGSELDAELVAQDAGRDLAVLSVDGNGELAALEIGDSTELGVGDPVVAVGNAVGLDGDLTVTTGIVSTKVRDIPVQPGITLRDMIQTDAAINPGNSGGPLVDAAGRVVGINSAGAMGAQSIGFAIPIDDAMPIIESLARGEVPARPFLGVQTVDLTDQVRSQAGVERDDGALVVDVTHGPAAENAGVRSGDVITGLAGHDVETSADLGDAASAREPDEAVEIDVDRGGERTLTMTVGSRARLRRLTGPAGRPFRRLAGGARGVRSSRTWYVPHHGARRPGRGLGIGRCCRHPPQGRVAH